MWQYHIVGSQVIRWADTVNSVKWMSWIIYSYRTLPYLTVPYRNLPLFAAREGRIDRDPGRDWLHEWQKEDECDREDGGRQGQAVYEGSGQYCKRKVCGNLKKKEMNILYLRFRVECSVDQTTYKLSDVVGVWNHRV